MARVYQMSWDGKNRRWLKEYRGKKYSVSCRQLNAPETKEGSYQAANAWWINKKKELDDAARPTPRALLPLEDLAAGLIGKPDLSDPLDVISLLREQAAKGRLELERLKIKGKEIDAEDVTEDGMRREAIAWALRDLAQKLVNGEPLPAPLLNTLPPARVQQLETGRQAIRGEYATDADKTVSAHIDRWLAMRQAKVATGERAAKAEDNFRIHLNHFKDFIGGQADVASINAKVVEDYYLWCHQKVQQRHSDPAGKAGWSSVYAQKAYSIARQFIKHLGRIEAIDQLPRNLDSPDYRFENGLKAVKTWTVEEFKAALAAATGQTRLHLLLMANCGMTQKDVSDLRDDEVDWEKGRITRKRSKTAKHKDVPVVSYRLWPETFALLKQHRSGQERVLLTESGQPWVWQELVNGKKRGSDNFRSNFTHLQDKLKGFNKPPKLLRKTAATLLDSHPEYSRYSTLFLGHSPRSIADRHYIKPSQEQFDEAVLWLGRQLGQVE
jgi:integrase